MIAMKQLYSLLYVQVEEEEEKEEEETNNGPIT